MQRIGIVLVGLVALSACDGSASERIEMVAGQRFEPPTVTISAGDIVRWTNGASDAHTVTAYENSLPEDADYFASDGSNTEDAARDNLARGLLQPDDSFEWTFEQPGRYEYFCIPHEDQGMTGVVVVEN